VLWVGRFDGIAPCVLWGLQQPGDDSGLEMSDELGALDELAVRGLDCDLASAHSALPVEVDGLDVAQ
jgi:hypothetical protein